MKFQILILFLICYTFLTAQQIYNWQNFTDMKNVSSVQGTASGVWAASSGGGFFFNSSTNTFRTLHKTDGLIGSSLTAVTIDSYGKIWFGSDDGTIGVYNPETNQIKTILDIYNNTDQSNKSINDLKSVGDTIYASTDFGVSLIDSKKYIFYDTFFKYGNFQPYLKVNNSLKAGLIYLSTSGGIAIQKQGAVNLSAPESWNTFTTQNGLPSNNITKILKINNSVIAATDKGLSIKNDSSWTSFLPQFNNNIINDLLLRSDSLFIAVGKKVFLYRNNNVSLFDSSSLDFVSLSYSQSLGLIAATRNGVLELNSGSYKYPNGPQANQFPGLTIDNNGNLWSSSGKDVSGVGFYKYDGNSWTNYNRTNTPELVTNAFNFINSGPGNEIYLGSWGKGFTVFNDGNIENFTASNSPLVGLPTSLSFVVISGFGNDSRGNLWILNYWPGDFNSLSMLTPDSTWHLYSNPAELNRSFEQHYNLVVDPYDTKWYSVRDEQRLGLYYFNENHTYEDTSDDKFGYLTTNDGLNSNSIYSIIVDKRGDVWVGTSLGVNIITNNSSVLSTQHQFRISSVFALRQQTINAIAVDPLNNKWIGTNQGLLLVNSDGSSLLATYNSKNSPLPVDEIRSIAVDDNSGKVYVGTDAGLTSFETPAIKPVDSFSELFLYPNPFIVNNGIKNLTIDGLIKDSDIKILNIEGKLVNEFSSPGGRIAFWDGRDENGNFVASGIYFVVAFDREGNSITTSKVAVLHK
jgi:ligand-binding sensor domain-containing protein